MEDQGILELFFARSEQAIAEEFTQVNAFF